MVNDSTPVKIDPDFYWTHVNFNQFKNNPRIELVFKSSVNKELRKSVVLQDFNSLKNIKKQLEDIIKEIEQDLAGD